MDIPDCSKDKPVKRLIKTHSHMTISLNSYSETKALENVLQGIYDMQRLLKDVTSKPGFRHKSTMKIRKDLAIRISLIAEGLNQYFKHRLKRVEAFVCCVETFGIKRTETRRDIEDLNRMVMQWQKALDQIIRDCNNDDVSDNQVMTNSKHLQDKMENGLPQINELTWKIERGLREETQGIIMLCASDNDDLVSGVAKNLHTFAQDDPVSAGLQ